ncbi:MAG TPA: RDD family protein, partial [Myxococcota bacterium]|nr:RDD family protein [Myxococcota bacterium]
MRESADDRRVRALTTPEGLAMPVTLAGRGARAAALAIDVGIIFFGFLAIILLLIAIGGGNGSSLDNTAVGEFIITLLIIALFLSRYAYF